MSWQAVADVLTNSPSYGADRLVEIAIAERAADDGRGSRGSMQDIARRANLKHFCDIEKPGDGAGELDPEGYEKLKENACRSARRSVRKLEDLGRIQREGTTARGVGIYRVVFGNPRTTCPGVVEEGDDMSGPPDDMSGQGGTPGPGTPDEMSPKPSLNPKPKSSRNQQHDLDFHLGQLGARATLGAIAEHRDRCALLDDLRAQLPGSQGALRTQTERQIAALESSGRAVAV